MNIVEYYHPKFELHRRPQFIQNLKKKNGFFQKDKSEILSFMSMAKR